MGLAIPYLSVIAPMSIYQVLQDIASVEGANSAGDNYDARLVVACDGVGTFAVRRWEEASLRRSSPRCTRPTK